jgi:hypothetical protein
VIQVPNANAPPTWLIISRQEKSIITGTNTVSVTALLLRHCVRKSARNKDFKTAEVVGTIASILFI